MAKRVEAMVNRELLVWARTSAGLSLDQAAKKVQVRPERLESWEAGERRPTVKQLRKLGKVYRRPTAVFYLAEPPKDIEPLSDFRHLPGTIGSGESPQLRLEIRRAHNRREIALELYEELEGEPPRFSHEADISEDPEDLAIRLRELLGVTYEDQIKVHDRYVALSFWRSGLEKLGVLVFQAAKVDLSEMRGFSISETPLRVIVVNNADKPWPRIFTMLHEFVHVTLHEGGLCDLEDEANRPPEKNRVEVFCNRVAGAILVPKKELLEEEIVIRHGRRAEWSVHDIWELARQYGVSQEVLLRRLVICDRTTLEFYRKMREQFSQKFDEPTSKKSTGGPSPDRMVISTAGRLFISLALNSYYQENITASDLCDFLNVKLKHLGKIERKVMGRSIGFGALI